MGGHQLSRRSFLGASAGTATAGIGLSSATAKPLLADDSDSGLYTQIAFRALIDSVVPETPELATEFGDDIVAGGLDVGLADFMITYVNNMFSLDVPLLSEDGNLQIAKPFAKILDSAALKLVILGMNESGMSFDRPLELFDDDEASTIELYLKSGPFSKLERQDRLRAIGLLDEFELELSLPGNTFFEFDAGLIGQLVVGFTETVYYSEWNGFETFFVPPSQREHSNDPADVQGWQQTGFPGIVDGYAELRGFMSVQDTDLGDGQSWKSITDGVDITIEPGEFEENDYDTSDYEEPYPESEADSHEGDSDDDSDGFNDSDDSNDTDNGDDSDDTDNGDDSDAGWWF